jgi:hypothetical protein
MAGELPDPLELKSWEDAFSHPVPTVRKLEQQLRRHADENREKLRTLVGYVSCKYFKEEEADFIMQCQLSRSLGHGGEDNRHGSPDT